MPKSIIELAQNIGGVCMYVPLRYEQHLIIVSFTYISQAEAEICLRNRLSQLRSPVAQWAGLQHIGPPGDDTPSPALSGILKQDRETNNDYSQTQSFVERNKVHCRSATGLGPCGIRNPQCQM
jgi:hypothetical protein